MTSCLLAAFIVTTLASLLVWAFWLAPWVRGHGRSGARGSDWLTGNYIRADLSAAIRIARSGGFWPWPLRALVFLQVLSGCLLALWVLAVSR